MPANERTGIMYRFVANNNSLPGAGMICPYVRATYNSNTIDKEESHQAKRLV